MSKIEFTAKGTKDLAKLPKELQKRIIKKLEFFISQEDPLAFAKLLTNQPRVTHRFRVGDYRIAFYVEGGTIYVDRAKHRKEVYYLEMKILNSKNLQSKLILV